MNKEYQYRCQDQTRVYCKFSDLIPPFSERITGVSFYRLLFVLLKSGCCGVLKWCLLVEKGGDKSAPILQICSHMKFALSDLCEQCAIRSLVEVRN